MKRVTGGNSFLPSMGIGVRLGGRIPFAIRNPVNPSRYKYSNSIGNDAYAWLHNESRESVRVRMLMNAE